MAPMDAYIRNGSYRGFGAAGLFEPGVIGRRGVPVSEATLARPVCWIARKQDDTIMGLFAYAAAPGFRDANPRSTVDGIARRDNVT